MIFLAIDSTATTASCALKNDDTLLAEYTHTSLRTHSETLLPMIDGMMKGAGRSIDEVDVFACSAGPGSFTGVRIGVSLIKGLAFGKGKPCVPVSTLEALAMNLSGFEGLICPVMDARRSQFYTALFEYSTDGTFKRLLPDSALAADELESILRGELEQRPGRRLFFVGDGYKLAKELISLPSEDTPERLRYQSASSVATVARLMLERSDENIVSDEKLAPIYLRPSQAERTRNEAAQNK